MPHVAHEMLSAEMKKCIEACHSCEQVCLTTVTHCLQKGGRHAEATHIATLLACAELCASSAALMAMGSDLSARQCALCAEACERCARSCEALGDDPQMKACAEECRRCAESCRRMAA